ncbi:MAG: Na+/H+ antiporter NhaC family protein, partial [Thermoanaerobaculia bacterium]|nr:Na+/H+ antiporter NhaC family protein [Thermoanaerobaculia bacterium]
SYSNEALTPGEDVPKRAVNAFLPILSVIAVTVIGLFVSGRASVDRSEFDSVLVYLREVFAQSDPYAALVWASLSGVLVALVLGVGQRIVSVREGADALVEGFKSMIMAFSVLLLAWALGDVCSGLDTAAFLVELATGVLSPRFLPVVVFLLSAAIAFATGTSWGVMAILTPLSIPLATGLSLDAGFAMDGADFYLILVATVASVLAGSVWGDHCSPISDTTILSSMATGSDHIAHVRTQLPYALSAGAVAMLLCQIPAAYGLSPWIALVVGAAVLIAAVYLFGNRSELPDGERGELRSPR